MKYIICFLGIIGTLSTSAQVTLTYTGNMGVLLQHNEQTVLIDGLHEFYKPAYQNPSAKMVTDLQQPGGLYPVPQVSLVTHRHGDHYSAALHKALKSTVVIGSSQITAPLTELGYENVETVPYLSYERTGYQIKGINVQAFKMDHGNEYLHKQVQNIGFLVTLGDQKVLHVGDTDWYPKVFEALALSKDNIDVAILPIWLLMYDESETWLKNRINPVKIVATHIDPDTPQKEIDALAHRFPQAVFLRSLGEQHKFD